MDLITLLITTFATIYILIGLGVAIGIYLGSKGSDPFEELPLPSKIMGIFIISFFWIVVIPARVTYKLLE